MALLFQSPLICKASSSALFSHAAKCQRLEAPNPQIAGVAHAHPRIGSEALRSQSRRWRSSVVCNAAAGREADDGSSGSGGGDGDGNGGGFELDKAQLEGALQSDESKNLMDSLGEMVLQDEESKALLKEFATAAERVARAKQELEFIDRRERDLAENLSRMINKADEEESQIAALISESERAVLEAEEELKAAELALVTARAGGSVADLRKWESYDIDEDLERLESGKAAAVSVLAGTIASIPFYLNGNELGVGTLLSIGGVVVSCALFGVTYRYILRRDLGNIQLKSGAAAAFSLVRGIGQVDAIQLQFGYPAQGANEVFLAALTAVQGFFMFGFSALALDYCLREGILSPFPSKKS